MRIVYGLLVGACLVALYKLFGLVITIFAIGFMIGATD